MPREVSFVPGADPAKNRATTEHLEFCDVLVNHITPHSEQARQLWLECGFSTAPNHGNDALVTWLDPEGARRHMLNPDRKELETEFPIID